VNFSLQHRVQNGSGVHPVPYSMGTRGSSLGVKRPKREADHSPLVRRLKIRGAIPPLSQYVFMAWCLVKHRDNFTFIFCYSPHIWLRSGKFIIKSLLNRKLRYLRRGTSVVYRLSLRIILKKGQAVGEPV
jgi:hypothetical protein